MGNTFENLTWDDLCDLMCDCQQIDSDECVRYIDDD